MVGQRHLLNIPIQLQRFMKLLFEGPVRLNSLHTIGDHVKTREILFNASIRQMPPES